MKLVPASRRSAAPPSRSPGRDRPVPATPRIRRRRSAPPCRSAATPPVSSSATWISTASPASWPKLSLTIFSPSTSTNSKRARIAVALEPVDQPGQLLLEPATVGQRHERHRGAASRSSSPTCRSSRADRGAQTRDFRPTARWDPASGSRRRQSCEHTIPPVAKQTITQIKPFWERVTQVRRRLLETGLVAVWIEGQMDVGIIMGSRSDWETMRHAAEALDSLGVAHEAKVVSAHRTPDRLYDYADTAQSRGLRLIIAGAGGAAHLPGMAAAMTRLPVLGVPVQSGAEGIDSLLSIVQMPAGMPVGTLAIGKAGAINAGLLAAASSPLRRRAGGAARRLPRGADRLGRRDSPNDRAPAVDHRHHRRRPARADAGDRRGPARLRLPRVRPRRATRPRRESRRARPAPIRRRRGAGAIRRRSRRRHLRVREFARRRPRRARRKLRPGTASLAIAQDRAAEKRFIEAPWRHRRAAGGDRRAEARRRGRARSACRWSSRPAGSAMTARVRHGAHASPASRLPPGTAIGARAGGGRSAGRFRRRILGHPRPRGRRRDAPSGTSPRNPHAAASCAARRSPPASRRRPVAARGGSPAPSPRRSTMSAC